MSDADHPYQMSISLNVLNHLGIGLYSNVPAVLSEVVANAWDADARNVTINIDSTRGEIVIYDDGNGMTASDINGKYLYVGYQKRHHEPGKTAAGRDPMGRKGIGKLSVFSIADTVEIYTVKGSERNALSMNSGKIKAQIEGEKEGKGTYFPDPIDVSPIDFDKGTRIVLRNLRKNVRTTAGFLRRRLARRFSIIGARDDFRVAIDGNEVTTKDRDYYDNIEFLWYFGDINEGFLQKDKDGAVLTDTDGKPKLLPNLREVFPISGVVDGGTGYAATGWIGTVDEQKNIDEDNNTIVVFAHGKLIQEDVLKDLKEGGIYSKYLIGEIDADFMDSDAEDDIVTSDRQSVKEDDIRYEALKKFVQAILKKIQSQWRDLRNEVGLDRRAIAFKFAFAPQWDVLTRNDAAHSAEHLAIGSSEPAIAILREATTQLTIRYCRTTARIYASQCPNYNAIALDWIALYAIPVSRRGTTARKATANDTRSNSLGR